MAELFSSVGPVEAALLFGAVLLVIEALWLLLRAHRFQAEFPRSTEAPLMRKASVALLWGAGALVFVALF